MSRSNQKSTPISQDINAEFPNTWFVSMGNDREILGDKRGLAEALLSIVDGLEVVRLIDRDDRTEERIAELRRDGIRVLSKRNLESYLFDDEVLKALAGLVGKTDKTEEILKEKERIRSTRTDDTKDDLKSASPIWTSRRSSTAPTGQETSDARAE